MGGVGLGGRADGEEGTSTPSTRGPSVTYPAPHASPIRAMRHAQMTQAAMDALTRRGRTPGSFERASPCGRRVFLGLEALLASECRPTSRKAPRQRPDSTSGQGR